MTSLAERYGPWALVAGGAQGIGEAFSRYLAAQGINVVVVDVAGHALSTLIPALESEYGVDTLAIGIDLARPDALEEVVAGVGERAIGLLIYNAGISDVGPFYKEGGSLDFERRRLAVNVTGPLAFTYHFARPMLRRKTGGIILMSSGAGLQGSPYYAHYSATKAYDIALAQALWGEFRHDNVDVLACVAGLTLSTASHAFRDIDASQLQTSDELVAEAMGALGRQSTLIAGEHNRGNRQRLEQLPTDRRIEAIASHSIALFLGSVRPEQCL